MQEAQETEELRVVKEGQVWKATCNPYELQGFPSLKTAWEMGKLYKIKHVVSYPIIDNLVIFSLVNPLNPNQYWEIAISNFRLGFTFICNE